MYHHIARAVPGRRLWTYEVDGLPLWNALLSAFPEVVALCLMPDHLHLILPHLDAEQRLRGVLAGFARSRCVHAGVAGPLIAARPPPTLIADARHLRRTVRYVHLNPCRAGLASDPLCWALSTHRDRCGLVAGSRVSAYRDPAAFHAQVSADPHVRVEGTRLPDGPYREHTVAELVTAVSAVLRVPVGAVHRRGPARDLCLRASWAANVPPGEVAAWLDVHPDTVARRRPARPDEDVRRVLRVCGDPRFQALSGAPAATIRPARVSAEQASRVRSDAGASVASAAVPPGRTAVSP